MFHVKHFYTKNFVPEGVLQLYLINIGLRAIRIIANGTKKGSAYSKEIFVFITALK